MSRKKDGQPWGRYTLEFKIEAVRLVKGGQSVPVTAKILGMPAQTLGNWVRLSEKGELKGAGDRPVSPEQMELARVKMKRDILKNRPRGLPQPLCMETSSAYTWKVPGQRSLAFWRHQSPSKNLVQGKLRTQLWWHLHDPV